MFVIGCDIVLFFHPGGRQSYGVRGELALILIQSIFFPIPPFQPCFSMSVFKPIKVRSRIKMCPRGFVIFHLEVWFAGMLDSY